MGGKKVYTKTQTIALLGIFLALTVALSFLESLVSLVVLLPPGVKLGLANIIIMFCVFFLNAKYAFVLAVAKSGFVFLTKGFTAFVLSLCGSLSSVLVMLALFLLYKKASVFFISICGALTHNLAQLAAAWLFMRSSVWLYYLPVILISGIAMGSITALLLKQLMPALNQIAFIHKNTNEL